MKKSESLKKNKVMFVNPPLSTSVALKHNCIKFPLGFLYMAGHLEKNGFEVKILDCPVHYKKRRRVSEDIVKVGSYPEEIEKAVRDFKPDIIGLSCAYTAYESDSFDTARFIKKIGKKIDRNILVVIGGAHTSANPEFVLREDSIDIAVVGEGDETMLEIAEKYSKESLNKVKGIGFKENGKIRINPPRERIENLDEYDAAWHLIDMEMYFKHPQNSIATLRGPSVDILTSRGCPMNCVFCSIRTVWGRVWRGRSPKNVVNELEFLNKKYGVSQFRMFDDNLTLDRKRIIEICDEIIKRGLDIKWDTPNGIAFWTLDKEVLTKMKRAGCYRVTFGIESCSPKTQRYIRKIADLKKIDRLVDICHEIGLWVCATFIIGFPYETREQIEETRQYVIHSKINYAFMCVAQPYQGTDIYNDFKKENLLPEFKAESNVHDSKYNTLHLDADELNKLRSQILKEFYVNKSLSYLNPFVFYKEFLSKIRSYEDMKYVFKNFYNLVFVLV